MATSYPYIYDNAMPTTLGASPLNSAGQFNGDYSQLTPSQLAALQAALAQVQGMTPGASPAPVTDPRELLLSQMGSINNGVGSYINSVNDLPEGITNLAKQYGIDPQSLVDEYNTRTQQYNTAGNDTTRNFLKDSAGLAGLVGGGLALSGALGGAAAGSGAAADTAMLYPYTAAGGSIVGSPLTGAGIGTGAIGGDLATGGGSGAGSAIGGAGAPVPAGPDPDMLPGGALGGSVASNVPNWLSSLSSSGLLPLIGGGLGLVDSLLQPDHTTTTQGGTSNSTNTSSLQLPSQLTGGANTALDRANQLLTQGSPVAPLPALYGQVQNQLTNLPQNTAPTTSSFASGANINPYLDTEFNAAADATQNRLGSEFENAGQYGSPQNQQSRSQELQQLAAGIYGPGYQQAQQLQYGAQEAGVARGLQQQDTNINRILQTSPLLLGIGQQQQQQQQAQLNAPQTALNSYIGQLGGLSPYFPGTTNQTQATTQTGNVTQPLYNNPLSSIAGGAILGNYVGNIFGPQQQGNSYSGMQSPQNMTTQPVMTGNASWY